MNDAPDHTHDDDDPLFHAMDALLQGKATESVVPVLIVAAARAVVIDAKGDFDKLSTLILKFQHLMVNQAEEMFHGGQSLPH